MGDTTYLQLREPKTNQTKYLKINEDMNTAFLRIKNMYEQIEKYQEATIIHMRGEQ